MSLLYHGICIGLEAEVSLFLVIFEVLFLKLEQLIQNYLQLSLTILLRRIIFLSFFLDSVIFEPTNSIPIIEYCSYYHMVI